MTNNIGITEFTGQYRFLSNFDVHEPIAIYSQLTGYIRGETVEHLFQAAKADNAAAALLVTQEATPREAKRMGRQVQLRNDWELVKYDVMSACIRAKFNPLTEGGAERVDALVSTAPLFIREGNTWGDQTWGALSNVKGSPGRNWLGSILMNWRAVMTETTDVLDLSYPYVEIEDEWVTVCP